MFVTNRSIRHAVGEAIEYTQQCHEDQTNTEEPRQDNDAEQPDAGDNQEHGEVIPLPAIGDEDGAYFTKHISTSDNTLMPEMFTAPCEPDGNEVLTRDPEQLYVALEALCIQARMRVYKENAELLIAHEDQHAEGMRNLGMRAIRYGLRILSVVPDRQQYQLFTHAIATDGPLTKIEVASLFVAPEEPSDSDLRRVQDMGYSGIDDVAQRIIARDSTPGRRDMMVPFGYSGDLNGAVYL